jgi:hypothetical protein
VKLARQKLSKYYAEVTPTTSRLLISAQIVDPFWKIQSFWKWDKGMDINPDNTTSYIAQYKQDFLKYVVNEYCAKHQRVLVNKAENVPSSNLLPSPMASAFRQLSFD